MRRNDRPPRAATDPQAPGAPPVSRRDALELLGALAVSAAAGCSNAGSSGVGVDVGASEVGASGGDATALDAAAGVDGHTIDGAANPTPPTCVLTPEQVQGPYFVDTGLERSHITEGRPGAELRVRLTLVDVGTCAPIAGAAIELWHTDATGAYSGFDIADGNLADNAGLTFLRGYQRTNAQGDVEFTTIYPGWYPGRTTHVHVAVLLNGDRLSTTQVYFDDALTDRVYAEAPYSARGPRDTTNADDWIFRQGTGTGPSPLLLQFDEGVDQLAAHFVLGVNRA